MKNRKSIFVLLLLIALCVLANAYLYFWSADDKASGRQSLLETRADIVGLVVSRQQGADTVLRCESSGWRLQAPYVGSADGRVVRKVVDALSQSPIKDIVFESELVKLGRTLADFQLDAPVVRIELTDESGRNHGCAFGAATPTGDGVYACVGGLDAVFVVEPTVLAAVDVSADGFRLRSAFPPGSENVSGFEIKREGSPLLEFTRQGETWRMGSTNASAQKVSAFVADLTEANAVTFVWPVETTNETPRLTSSILAGYGLDPDSSITVTLNGADGTNRRISIGKEASDGLVYALIQNESAIATVPARLRDFALQDPVMFTDSRLFQGDARSIVFFSVSAREGLYAFSRDKDGGWSLESPIVAAADRSAVETILSRILSLSPADVVTSDGLTVSISTNAPKICVSRQSVLGDGAFESLRSREVLRIDPALAKRIVRTSAKDGARPTTVVYSRDRRVWSVEDGEDGLSVDAAGVEAVLSSVNPLVAVRVEKLNVAAAELDDYGLDKPFLTLAIDQDSDTAVRRNILVGKKAKDGRFATTGSADAVFVLPESTVDRLLTPIVSR